MNDLSELGFKVAGFILVISLLIFPIAFYREEIFMLITDHKLMASISLSVFITSITYLIVHLITKHKY